MADLFGKQTAAEEVFCQRPLFEFVDFVSLL